MKSIFKYLIIIFLLINQYSYCENRFYIKVLLKELNQELNIIDNPGWHISSDKEIFLTIPNNKIKKSFAYLSK